MIYTLTTRDAERVAGWLQTRGIDARPYFGDTQSDERQELEDALLSNGVKALVATSALGMGFDKPDLGFVIHYQRPGSVVHYYQQVGRAGRKLDLAYGVLLGGKEDEEITNYFIQNAFPPEAHVNQVLGALKKSENGLHLWQLEQCLNLSHGQLEKVLKMLSARAGAPVGTRREGKNGSLIWYRTPVPYQQDEAKIAQLTQLRQQEQRRMDDYLHSHECLMRFLARELDDPTASCCGQCAVCVGAPLLPTQFAPQMAADALTFLRHLDNQIEPRKQWNRDSLKAYGWAGNIPDMLRAEEGRSLSVWGDDGWSPLVKRGKHAGQFDLALVQPLQELIHRWNPEPSPRWVTCVPSLNNPTLVPGIARKLAESLGLPFVECVYKVKQHCAQKAMQNSYQQASNLAGAFAVKPSQVLASPVLLVDDMVDSRWTFTVVAAMLRQCGSGQVFPLALSNTRSSGDL